MPEPIRKLEPIKDPVLYVACKHCDELTPEDATHYCACGWNHKATDSWMEGD